MSITGHNIFPGAFGPFKLSINIINAFLDLPQSLCD